MTESPIRRVAVRGDAAVADALASTEIEVCGLGDAQAVVAVGEHAFTGAALSVSGTPLLAVDVGEGVRDVARDVVDDAAAALRAGDYRTVAHPVIDVAVGGERVGRAVFDVTLMTSEPARISEYGVARDGDRLWTGRADGVVVASPLGSAGYARAAGGSIVVGGENLSVVPVAPFSTRADTWVVDGRLELTVERDEGDVSLFADDEELRRVGREHAVRVSPTDGFTMLQPTVE